MTPITLVQSASKVVATHCLTPKKFKQFPRELWPDLFKHIRIVFQATLTTSTTNYNVRRYCILKDVELVSWCNGLHKHSFDELLTASKNDLYQWKNTWYKSWSYKGSVRVCVLANSIIIHTGEIITYHQDENNRIKKIEHMTNTDNYESTWIEYDSEHKYKMTMTKNDSNNEECILYKEVLL